MRANSPYWAGTRLWSTYNLKGAGFYSTWIYPLYILLVYIFNWTSRMYLRIMMVYVTFNNQGIYPPYPSNTSSRNFHYNLSPLDWLTLGDCDSSDMLVVEAWYGNWNASLLFCPSNYYLSYAYWWASMLVYVRPLSYLWYRM